MNEILTALAAMAQSFGRSFKSLTEAVNGVPDKIATKLTIKKDIQAQTRVLSAYADKLENAVKKMSDPQFTIDVDTSAIQRSLMAIASDIRAFKIPNLQTVETRLAGIEGAIRSLPAAIAANIKLPTTKTASDTFKLDPMQLAQLRVGNGGGVAALQGRKATLTNTTIANNSTEYSYTFPKETVAWTFKLRSQNIVAYYSWTSGKLPSGGDSSLYFTVPQNFLRSVENVDYSGRTIYFGAAAATVAEIEVFTA